MLKKIIVAFLAVAMLLSFTTACKEEENTVDTKAIAGEYILDASNLGMPMKWFIKITEDAKFTIATDRAYSNTKGDGTIGNTDDTYMFVYSDSTNESPKTATFKVEGSNLVFSTSVPIGTASIAVLEEDGNKIYPTAKAIKYEEYLGEYVGTYEKVSPMAGTVNYSYELVLNYGMEYSFASSFSMMGEIFTITESGSFAIDGTKITFTATTKDGKTVEEPVAVEGTVENKQITAAFKLSMMASEAQTVTAKFAIYSDVAGTYTGKIVKAMGPMTLEYDTKLVLDALGGYKYTTTDSDGEEAYAEEGTFVAENGVIKFTSNAEGAAAVEGTYNDYTVTTKFPMSSMVPTPVDTVVYAESVSGTFSTEATENDVKYNVSLTLVSNTFELKLAADGNDVYTVSGTFEIKTGMMDTLAFTAENVSVADADLTVFNMSAPISDSGINVTIPYDLNDTATIGFSLTK